MIQFEICGLIGAEHVSLSDLDDLKLNSLLERALLEKKVLLFVCRRGVDSLIAAKRAKLLFSDARVFSMRGGLGSWAATVDKTFPIY